MKNTKLNKAYYEKNREQDQDFVIGIMTKKQLEIDEHFHMNMEITYVIDGEAIAIINNSEYRMKEDDLSFSLRYESHGYHVPESCTCYGLILPEHQTKPFEAFLGDRVFMSNFLPKNDKSPFIRKCLDDMMKENHPLVNQGYICLILGIILDKLKRIDSKNSHHKRDTVCKILHYLHLNFLENIKIGDLAKAIGYNSCYLSTIFNACFQCTFNEYLNSIRLRHALELLSQGHKKILDVAFASGFNSLRTFNRVFQNEFGLSPREYIKQKENEDKRLHGA